MCFLSAVELIANRERRKSNSRNSRTSKFRAPGLAQIFCTFSLLGHYTLKIILDRFALVRARYYRIREMSRKFFFFFSIARSRVLKYQKGVLRYLSARFIGRNAKTAETSYHIFIIIDVAPHYTRCQQV